MGGKCGAITLHENVAEHSRRVGRMLGTLGGGSCGRLMCLMLAKFADIPLPAAPATGPHRSQYIVNTGWFLVGNEGLRL